MIRADVTARHSAPLGKLMDTSQQQPEQPQREHVQVEFSLLMPGGAASQGRGGATPESPSLSLKIREVGFFRATQPDVATRLRSTWLGQIYINHLKRYVFMRLIVRWVWRLGYPFYVNQLSTRFRNTKAKQWRPLIKLSDFARKSELRSYTLVDAAIVEISEPRVFPVSDRGHLGSSQDRYQFPEIFVAIIKNAMTYGGTNLVLVDGEVVCHDLYDFKRDYTSEELHGRVLIDPKVKRIRWLLSDKDPESIHAAATFVDACAPNYAHWMTEVLPRIVVFCADERFKDVSIVVNGGLHKNIMESLRILAGSGREIITLPIGRALLVDELYLTSAAGYVPFGQRTNKLSGHSHGIFSPPALDILRHCSETLEQNIRNQPWPEKIFLRRSSGIRRVTNAVELEGLFVARGYVLIEPESLTFSQQVQLFRNAKIIVAPTGAGLANAIFCKPGTQVAILMGKHTNMIYRYWCNLLVPLGIKVSYVLGNIVQCGDLGIHGDFAVDVASAIDLLEDFERK